MFTVKATYRNETRKFTFAELSSLPSYAQLYHQLYRIFPISNSYYLSKLLFSPEVANPSRILIGREVHSAKEYDACAAPFRGKTWPNALLRFSVFDETPHKLPSVVSDTTPQLSLAGDGWWGGPDKRPSDVARGPHTFISPQSVNSSASTEPTAQGQSANSSALNLSPFHIPPPPIIYSPAMRSQTFMDMDPTRPTSPWTGLKTADASHSTAQPQPSPSTTSCCSVSEAKSEVHSLLTTFKADLDGIISKSFGSFTPQPPALLPTMASRPLAPLLPFPSMSHWCALCQKSFNGPWYACEECKTHILCPLCNDQISSPLAFCPVSPSGHDMRRHDTMARSGPPPVPSAFTGFPILQPSTNFSNFNFTIPLDNHFPYIPDVVVTDHSKTTGGPSGPRPFDVSAFDSVAPFIPSPLTDSPSTRTITPFSASSTAPFRPWTPPAAPTHTWAQWTPQEPPSAVPPARRLPTPPPAPVVHKGVVCDVCEFTIIGVRHKCLDCRDYDLCTGCFESGQAETHNPFHEFLDIKEPGRVIVHTVYSGDGERDSRPSNSTRAQVTSPAVNQTPEIQDAVHNATCDLCDSRIIGTRFKCVNCPDFDTCTACFSITSEQHPGHGFVKVRSAEDLILRNKEEASKHFATCNICDRTIHGIRYKCMHQECYDFDLCEGCEAHPIALHPSTHPLLKMKSPQTLIPNVLKPDQATSAFDQSHMDVPKRGRSPSPEYASARSYSRGYLHNPARRNRSRSPVSPIIVRPISMSPRRSRSPRRRPKPRSRSPLYRRYSRSPVSMASRSPSRHWCPRRRNSRSPVRSPSPPAMRILEPPLVARRSWSPTLMARRLSRSPSRSRSRSPPGPRRLRRRTSPSVSRSRTQSRSPRRHRSPSCSLYVPRPSSPMDVVQCSLPNPAPVSIPNSPVLNPDFSVLSANQIAIVNVPLSLEQEENLSSPSVTAGTETPSLPSFQSESSSANFKLPPLSLDPSRDLAREFWPRVSQQLRHLLQEPTGGNATSSVSINQQSEPKTADEDTMVTASALPAASPTCTASTLTGEALLKRPVEAFPSSSRVSEIVTAILNGRAISDASIFSEASKPVPPPELPLSAAFVSDLTVPDGQIFPPGAEFVKAWRLLNDGPRDWPESTQLAFTAGDSLTRGVAKPEVVRVGAVGSGEETEVWSGELKAPEIAGRYVGYWSLTANSQYFGHKLWIDIIVAEPSRSEGTSDGSLSSSSIIVMPERAPVPSTVGSDFALTSNAEGVSPSISSPDTTSPVTAPSNPRSEDDSVSDSGSSVSLISLPSSSDDDDPAIWEDSRSHMVVPETGGGRDGMEYVVLYDENSSEEE